MAVLKDELGQRIAVVREEEVDDDVPAVVDESDLPVLLHGGQSILENPGPEVLGGHCDLAGVDVVVPPLAPGAEDGQGVVGGTDGPVGVEALDGDLPGRGVLEGHGAVLRADRDHAVVEQEPVFVDVLRFVLAPAAGGEENGRGED